MKLAYLFLVALVSVSLAQTQNPLTVIKDGFGSVSFLRFSPSGGELARVCQFGPVVLFDTNGYRKARTFEIGMRMVAYSPDGTRIATAEGTDGARVWDAAAAGKSGPSTPIVDELRVLDAPLQVLQAASKDPKVRVFLAEFSSDGKRLITGHANGHVKVWNTGAWTLEQDAIVTESEVRAAAFAPDNKTIVIGDTNGVLHQWSLDTNAEIKTLRAPSNAGAIIGLGFAFDGRMMFTTHQSASNTSAMIWNTSTWVAQIENGFGSAAFSKDGKVLALGGSHIKLMDPTSWKQIRTIELPEMTLRESSRQPGNQPNADTKIPIRVSALAFSPDGRTLAAGCQDGTIRLLSMGEFYLFEKGAKQ